MKNYTTNEKIAFYDGAARAYAEKARRDGIPFREADQYWEKWRQAKRAADRLRASMKG